MKQILISTLKFLLGWPLSILALFFIFQLILSQQNSLKDIENISLPFTFFGAFCFFCYFTLRTILWKKILEYKGHNIPLHEVAYSWESAEIKRFLPGMVWAFVARTVLFSKKEVSKKEVVAALLIEAQCMGAIATVYTFFALPFFIVNVFPTLIMPHWLFWLIGIGVFVCLLFFVFHQPLLKSIHFRFITHSLPHFKPLLMIKLLLLTSLALFAFGLGNYLTFSALFPLPMDIFWELISFFVLSLFMSYLAFITPMGLGIREGIIAVGLSKLVTLSVSALGAVYIRVIIIIAEIIFFAVTFVWHKAKRS